MKILLTGAGGFVGARVKAAIPEAVAAPSLRGFTREDVKRLMDETRPDAVIHTAAVSDIGACGRDPEGSYHANVLIPEYFAREAGGAKLVMFSSDQVYGGCIIPGPFREEETAPTNLYAREKLEMEERVLAIDPGAVMLRATWMYDMPLYGVPNRGNFIVNVLRAAATGTPLQFSDTEHRGVTYVREVAAHIPETLTLPGGVYNYGSENDLTMYETALFLARELHLKADIRPAERNGQPRHLWMDCGKLKRQGVHFASTTEGLKACISDYSLKV